MSRIAHRIEKASWIGFLIWFAFWIVYNFWAFRPGGPWPRAVEDGGGTLPEMQPGFPPIEPQRSLEALGSATRDYILWQAFDIPYALLNWMVFSTAIALALKAARLGATPLKYLTLLPAIYFGAEIVEDALVALFASGRLAPSEPVVLIQQLATTIKFASGYPSFGLAALGLVVALAAAIIRLFRKTA